ncbi:AraC family transcriptional regulator [Pontibacter sp. JAM-7]|uniref:AraC family transcriptional regulator n=1 Tax=Pontibacter sp. JAM-7 TaxID=3366581 RepID=UPI003AF7B9F5
MANIRHTQFHNARLTALGVEPLTLSQMQAKLPSGPERVEFYMLMLVTAGQGRHKVDFVDYSLRPGSLLLVRPGQVQEWQLNASLAAEIILVDPASLPHGELLWAAEADWLALAHWPNHSELSAEVCVEIMQAVTALGQDFALFNGSELDIALIRHQLLCLLIRVARLQQHQYAGQTDRSRKTYRMFIDLLEQHYQSCHQLHFYATKLGFAESTLSRACYRAEGYSAKAVIDRRIALEAKRMLVHSQATVSEISFYLGFSESTNFSKFFRRLEGCTPQVFRQSRTA